MQPLRLATLAASVLLHNSKNTVYIKNHLAFAAINIWKEKNSTMDIMVDGKRAAYVAGMLHERDIPFSVAVGDVGLLMEKESNLPSVDKGTRRGPGSSQSKS